MRKNIGVLKVDMKLMNAIAFATVFGSSFVTTVPALAYCRPYIAATKIKEVVKGGGSIKQGWQVARQEGDWDGKKVCTYRVNSYLT